MSAEGSKQPDEAAPARPRALPLVGASRPAEPGALVGAPRPAEPGALADAPRPAEPGALADALAARTAPAELHEGRGAGLRCTACAHRCVLGDEGRVGACGVRFVRDGALRAPFGYVARRYVRPVETNTMYHVRPGARALTFGMFGCDLRCGYCHNARLSQALRDGLELDRPIDLSAGALVGEALAAGAEVLCAAYNEPLIAAEWVRAVFAEAKAAGLVTGLVSDGHTTAEALSYLRPVTDVFRVDLKGATAAQYRALGGRREPVLEALREAKRLGYWVEVVTLVVPGFNDEPGGLRDIAAEIAAVDPAIPWHLNAFFPRYKLADRPRTDALTLLSAAGTGYARGLSFVYAGNLASELGELCHTRCPRCRAIVVERHNYETRACRVERGRCPACGEALPGLWR
ncbi:MAG TPA: radical SAM protein [Polyangiaceae bacterium]|nr:radical SAM protein [Polyangiaceae bacterium]